MKKHILVVPGDGIGQEVTAVGKKVLEKIAEKFGHEFTYDEALIGHVAIEATGEPLPAETLEKMRASDAILLVLLVTSNMITIHMQKFVLNKDC
jgi:3-isopropylmalate dehydrogenase